MASPSRTGHTGPHVHKDTLPGLLSPSLDKDAYNLGMNIILSQLFLYLKNPFREKNHVFKNSLYIVREGGGVLYLGN